jgi:hypothetical protein
MLCEEDRSSDSLSSTYIFMPSPCLLAASSVRKISRPILEGSYVPRTLSFLERSLLSPPGGECTMQVYWR